jgi:hypothetical protein
MEKINNKRLMVTYSIMKFIMPCFNVNKNRSHNKIKLYPGGGEWCLDGKNYRREKERTLENS